MGADDCRLWAGIAWGCVAIAGIVAWMGHGAGLLLAMLVAAIGLTIEARKVGHDRGHDAKTETENGH